MIGIFETTALELEEAALIARQGNDAGRCSPCGAADRKRGLAVCLILASVIFSGNNFVLCIVIAGPRETRTLRSP